jgi:hypothetical protein
VKPILQKPSATSESLYFLYVLSLKHPPAIEAAKTILKVQHLSDPALLGEFVRYFSKFMMDSPPLQWLTEKEFAPVFKKVIDSHKGEKNQSQRLHKILLILKAFLAGAKSRDIKVRGDDNKELTVPELLEVEGVLDQLEELQEKGSKAIYEVASQLVEEYFA